MVLPTTIDPSWLDTLTTTASPKDREVEAQKAKARWAARQR